MTILGFAGSDRSSVFRNYYFEPFSNVSIYLPLGAPVLSNIRNQQNSFVYTTDSCLDVHTGVNICILRASVRSLHFCHFRGRRIYAGLENRYVIDDREKLFESAANDKDSLCVVEELRARAIDEHSLYMRDLMQTVFALCPPGNNPETFRIYEVSLSIVRSEKVVICQALETGAIPLLLTETYPPSSFLLTKCKGAAV